MLNHTLTLIDLFELPFRRACVLPRFPLKLCIVLVGFVIYSRDALTEEEGEPAKKETVLTMTPRGSRKTPKRR